MMAGKTAPARTAFTPPLGHPPSIEQRPVGELEVDPVYQRSTEGQDSRTAIRRIAEQWDWRLCAPLTVSRRVTADGTAPRYFVIDGQHRLQAARMRGDIAYLPCIISTFATIAEEAACFVAVNTKRKAISSVDAFRAALAAGDPGALQIKGLLDRAGLTVAPTSNPTGWQPGDFAAIGGVRQAINRHGVPTATWALIILSGAFPNQVLRYAGTILRGLYEVVAGSIDHRKDWSSLIMALAAQPQDEWFRAMLFRQHKHGELPDTAMHFAILDAWRAWLKDPA